MILITIICFFYFVASPPPIKKKTPSAWKGFVDVPEVVKFFTTAHAVHGNAESLTVVCIE